MYTSFPSTPSPALPALKTRREHRAAEQADVDYPEAPRADELPVGSAQVTFTMILKGDHYVVLTHSIGIASDDEYQNFLNIAADKGVVPDF